MTLLSLAQLGLGLLGSFLASPVTKWLTPGEWQ